MMTKRTRIDSTFVLRSDSGNRQRRGATCQRGRRVNRRCVCEGGSGGNSYSPSTFIDISVFNQVFENPSCVSPSIAYVEIPAWNPAYGRPTHLREILLSRRCTRYRHLSGCHVWNPSGYHRQVLPLLFSRSLESCIMVLSKSLLIVSIYLYYRPLCRLIAGTDW